MCAYYAYLTCRAKPAIFTYSSKSILSLLSFLQYLKSVQPKFQPFLINSLVSWPARLKQTVVQPSLNIRAAVGYFICGVTSLFKIVNILWQQQIQYTQLQEAIVTPPNTQTQVTCSSGVAIVLSSAIQYQQPARLEQTLVQLSLNIGIGSPAVSYCSYQCV